MTRVPRPYRRQEVNLLRVLTSLLFLGRAWQHLYWDPPFRALFWDRDWFGWFIEGWLGLDWDLYTTSPEMDQNLMVPVRVMGWIYLGLALFSVWLRPRRNRGAKWLWLGSACLFLLSFLYFKEQFWRLGQWMEFALQVGTPLLLWHALAKGMVTHRLLLNIRRLIVVTFVGHGLYAVGWYPVPGHFVDMVINVFGVSEATAKSILWVAGILDFSLVFGLFLPRVQRYFIAYAIFWGSLTALARIVAHFRLDFLPEVLQQWGFEVLVRLPHAGIPLLLWWLVRPQTNGQSVEFPNQEPTEVHG